MNPVLCSLQELDVLLSDDIRFCLESQYEFLYQEEKNGVCSESARHHVSAILRSMKAMQTKTICRVNQIVTTREELIQALLETLTKWTSQVGLAVGNISIKPHHEFDDVLCVSVGDNIDNREGAEEHSMAKCRSPPESPYPIIFSNWPRRKAKGWPMTHRVIICDRFCGEAVLRGSDVFVPGVIGGDAGIEAGEQVAVYAHLADTKTQAIQRGFLLQNYNGKCVFLGLGTSLCSRSDLFRLSHGVAVQMSVKPHERVGPLNPPFYGVLSREMMLQNLPSVLVGHVLSPRIGDVILDACAAPGGKTSHLASLVRNQAIIIACDKSRKKVISAKEMFLEMGATCITPIALDSTKCVGSSKGLTIVEILSSASTADDGLPNITSFPPESFDRILLDPPCSALGLRPKLHIDLSTMKDLQGYPKYQRKFVKEAVALLKPGGIMTYSTCTMHAHENEGMVRHILDEYPCMQLEPIEIDIGLHGLPGFGLTETHRTFVRRFDPSVESDTMGFFVAKLRKLVA